MSAGTLVGVPVDADVLARVLARHDDYRILRRMQPMDRRRSSSDCQGVITGIAIDVETTGLDLNESAIIELAVQRFRADEHGRIVETGHPRSWLEDPGVPITEMITRLTRLSKADVAGKSIMEAEAATMIADSDVVIAHNAGFDRGFVERRLPFAAGKAWICSMRDFDWQAAGFEGRTLTHLLGQMGWFYEAHRAGTDVTALLHLLDHRLDTGTTVLKSLLERASRPTWMIEATGAPFEAKDVLRLRGYRWNAPRKVWSREVEHSEFDDEIEWASLYVYRGGRKPAFREVTWRERYAATA